MEKYISEKVGTRKGSRPGRPKVKEKLISIRIKPEIARYIQRTEGKNQTEKFENLILFCMKREAMLKQLEITYEKRLHELENQIIQAEKKIGELK